MKHFFLLLSALFTLLGNSQAQNKVKLNSVWTTEPKLTTVESAIYDPATKLIYASCINGKPDEKDQNGFIAQVSSDGVITNAEWIKGLNAPKGMAILDGKLYVTDIDELVIIDIASGSITKKIPVGGSKFLNDVVADTKNKMIYFTDSYNKQIYQLNGEKYKSWFTHKKFNKLNGLFINDGTMLIADMGSGKVFTLDIEDKELNDFAEGIPNADGICMIGKNSYLVSNWGGEIYSVDKKGKVAKVISFEAQKLNSADISYNEAEGLVLVPTFFGNTITTFEIQK